MHNTQVTGLDTLLAYLRDVPTATSFKDSVELLRRAFATEPSENPAVDIDHDDIAFYGKDTLAALFGSDFADVLYCRRIRLGEQVDGDAQQDELCGTSDDASTQQQGPRNLRSFVDRYAVIGFEEQTRLNGAGGVNKVLRKVILRCGLGEQIQSASKPPKRGAAALERVRVRGGLMNRRQACLLANHLNHFRRSPSRDLPMTWRVVRGPEASAPVRDWLDALGGAQTFLRRLGGSYSTWGLTETTSVSLAVFQCEAAAQWHPEQVFAYARPRMVLPTRYSVGYLPTVAPASLPDGCEMQVRRVEGCPKAYAMAQAYVEAGFINDSGRELVANPLELWEETPDFDGPRVYWSDEDPAQNYSEGLERSEALELARYLRATGEGRRVKIRALGLRGRFGEGACGTADYLSSFQGVSRSLGGNERLEREYWASAEFQARP